MTPHDIILAAIKTAATPEDATTAVLELVGPQKLVWSENGADGTERIFSTGFGASSYGYGTDLDRVCWYRLPVHPYVTVDVATEAEGRAACQRHADAAHWAGMKLGEMMGGGNE